MSNCCDRSSYAPSERATGPPGVNAARTSPGVAMPPSQIANAPLAAQAGLSMLYKGGNAADAAIATAITLTVVEPTGNGIGSDAFAILWDGSKLHGLNASGRSPERWTLDRFKGRTAMPAKGWDAVTVPGAVSAWVALSERFGKLPFARTPHGALPAPRLVGATPLLPVAVATTPRAGMPPVGVTPVAALASSGIAAADTVRPGLGLPTAGRGSVGTSGRAWRGGRQR